MSMRRLAVLLVGLALLATGAFVVVSLTARKAPEKPASRADFKAIEVRAVDPNDRSESSKRAEELTPKVVDLLNRYYRLAFLRPKEWDPASDSPAPGQSAIGRFSLLFIDEAKSKVAENAGALTLADLGGLLERVDPTLQNATKISIEVEPDGSTPFAVVSVTFQATGTPRQKPKEGRSEVQITHTATYWLALEGESFRIFAYSAELRADEKVVTAAFGPRGGGVR